MKMDHDPFPRTPAGFHLRVEEILMGLEARKAIELRVRRIRWIAVAAALLALALGTAVAVVQGNALRTRMAAGGDGLVSQVRDIHKSAAQDGFSFIIEEVLAEGDAIFLSYTATVPSDGRIYLFSPCGMALDGVPLTCDTGLETDFFSNLYALGGMYGNSITQVIKLRLQRNMPETAARLSCSCAFMLAERPLKRIDAAALDRLLTEPDASGNANQLMRNAETLYYYDTSVEGDPIPMVYLHYYPEIRAIFEKKGRNMLAVEDVERAGIGRIERVLELSIPMGGEVMDLPLRNDVTQHIYFMDGYSIELRRLHLTPFEAEFEALIRTEGDGLAEWTEDLPFGQYYELCNGDGSDFGRVDFCLNSGDIIALGNGGRAYMVSGSMGGVFPVDGLNEICLAPVESGKRDMGRSIRLTPIRNPDCMLDRPEPAVDPAETDNLSS